MVNKMGYFFLSSNIEITLEQINDYEMIPEYQLKVKLIYEKFCFTSHDLLFGAMEGQVCHILSSFQLLAYVQWTRVFPGLTVTFVTKTDTNVL